MRLLGSINDDMLLGGDLADELLAGAGDDFLDGRDGGDSLYGQDGDDTLVGSVGGGNDLYDGGAGRDLLTYYEALAGVRVNLSALTEQASSMAGNAAGIGIDQLRGIEDVEGTPFADELRGDALANMLIGREGNDYLSGASGNDTLLPGTGDDHVIGGGGYDTVDYSEIGRSIYVSLGVAGPQNTGAGRDSFVGIENVIGGQWNDVLSGSATHNVLTGLGGSDRLLGGAGNDTLDGGAGTDRMAGGTGNDTYLVDSAADRVFENAAEGTDTVIITGAMSYALGANLERLTILAPSTGEWDDDPEDRAGLITLTGNGLDNVLTAGDGANVLDGGAGADRMAGGLGEDLYIVDDARDVVIEQPEMGIGSYVRDTVRASVSFTLPDAVENLELTGTADLAGSGNRFDNHLEGNGGANLLRGFDGTDELFGEAGSDRLDGGAGQDGLWGGKGDDTYVVDDAGDTVWEAPDEGIDTVQSSVSFMLYDAVENLVLTGTAAVDGFGSALGNVMKGNAAANRFYGYGGNDLLYGYGGGDSLYGLDGNDRLQGGAGADVVAGGTGSDLFVFAEGEFGGVAAGSCDLIHDFYSSEGDRISLVEVDADVMAAGDQAFRLVGDTAFSGAAGELRVFEQNGSMMIAGDVNGDGAADFAIQLYGVMTLTAADFIL